MKRGQSCRLHLGLILAMGAVDAPALAQDLLQRVITLGGSVTEIAVALGAGDRLVAHDTTSNFPESITALPDVGYIRRRTCTPCPTIASDTKH
jgi:iron complex transport system substrate-binding protein